MLIGIGVNMGKLDKIKRVILQLYLKDKSIVNDDRKLLAKVYEYYGWSYRTSIYENLLRMPSAESVTRARRKLHEDGLISYSQKALDMRIDEFNEYRTYEL